MGSIRANKSMQQNLLPYQPYDDQQQYIDIQDQLENPYEDIRNQSQDANPYKRTAARGQLTQKYEGQHTERCTGSQVSDRSTSGKNGSVDAK